MPLKHRFKIRINRINRFICLLVSRLCSAYGILLCVAAISFGQCAEGPEIVGRYSAVMNTPPKKVPSFRVVDGPILGNGDVGVVLAGPPEAQVFYYGKNDFWSQQPMPLSVGGLTLRVPELVGASYRQEQDFLNAEVRGTFVNSQCKVQLRNWVSATENLVISEIESQGDAPLTFSATLFPAPIRLEDRGNGKTVNLGREQHEGGRWNFNGYIDEVNLYDRALSAAELAALSRMEGPREGLVRRWGFDKEEGASPQDTPARLITPPVKSAPQIWQRAEAPEPGGDANNNNGWGLGKKGRAVRLLGERSYVEAGTAPSLQQVTVAAWIYIFSAGDANYILTKGDWNEAYSLGLDQGRLRFNVGERFVRTGTPLPVHQWIHVAGTFDGTLIRAFVNGSEVVPGARLLTGGGADGTIWVTRSADGPVNTQLCILPQPVLPSSAQGMKGREVTFATRVVGVTTEMLNDGVRFQLKPGGRAWLVTAILSDLDDSRHVSTARERVAVITAADLQQLGMAHRAWWRRFWSESFVEIGDPILEKYYYSSQYIIASASRAGKVAPGLYGPWITTDNSMWFGDYTLNYNYQTPYLALFSSNHIATADSYDAAVLDFLPRGKLYARELLNVRGVYYPGHIGPWGLHRAVDSDPFMGAKSHAGYCAVPMVLRFYHTYDLSYAAKVYPFIREVGEFWEDYLKFENGQYNSYHDCGAEAGPWNGPRWQERLKMTNPSDSMSFARVVMKGLNDMSRELNLDADRREKWRHIYEHLAPATSRQQIWPGGLVGLDSDPVLLTRLRERFKVYSTNPLSAPNLVRIGANPIFILDNLRLHCQQNALPNAYIYFDGGGVETASTVPATINEMLLQSNQGILRLFPVWPRDRDARFGNLRAYGAFLVSSELRRGEVQSLVIESEKGRDCTLLNPWLGRSLTLVRAGGETERLSGDRVTFKTTPGERVELRPE